jgi:hypothetical protein
MNVIPAILLALYPESSFIQYSRKLETTVIPQIMHGWPLEYSGKLNYGNAVHPEM